MGKLGFSPNVERRGDRHKTRVTIDQDLTPFGLPGMTLKSSANEAPNIGGGRWPPSLAWSITDRLSGNGSGNGRVLAVWHRGQVVAACSWHIEKSGPLVIFDLGCRSDLPREHCGLAKAVLLGCLRDIAADPKVARGPDALRWADHHMDRSPDPAAYKGELRARAKKLKFTDLRPRPRWWKGRWATERQF